MGGAPQGSLLSSLLFPFLTSVFKETVRRRILQRIACSGKTSRSGRLSPAKGKRNQPPPPFIINRKTPRAKFIEVSPTRSAARVSVTTADAVHISARGPRPRSVFQKKKLCSCEGEDDREDGRAGVQRIRKGRSGLHGRLSREHQREVGEELDQKLSRRCLSRTRIFLFGCIADLSKTIFF